jgi:hypothetical protein
MTQENSYHRPKLIIDDKEVLFDISGSLKKNSSGNINSMTVTINSVDLQIQSLFNKKIKLFLNDGSEDSVPMFNGFVKEVKPTETNVKLTAVDVRSLLKTARVTLTDFDNYDGYTIGQFLHTYITDFININETLIGLDMLKDIHPPVYMTGERGENLNVFSLVKKIINKTIDDDDLENPLGYFLDVYEDGTNSNIVITKDKLLTSVPSYVYSFTDGLENYEGKKRNPANTVFYDKNYFAYTNRPTGIAPVSISKQKDSKTTRDLGLKQILLEQSQKEEITITVNKGKDIGLGSIVHIDVDDEDIRGAHRVQGKQISFGKSSKCTLELNKKAPILEKFLS